MATFEDETEPETPSAEASIYIMKTAIGREQTASERLADRVRRSGAPVWSILARRGYNGSAPAQPFRRATSVTLKSTFFHSSLNLLSSQSPSARESSV